MEGLSREKERAVLQQIKEMENIGFAFESADASVDLMLRRSQEGYRPSFSLIDYTVAVANRAGRGLSSEATIKVEVGDQIYHEVAEGNGPVNALMLALRKAIHGYFPQLDRMHLLDYKVRILNSDQGTGASVRVLITSSDGARNWTTVGGQHQYHRGQLDGDIRRSRILFSSPTTSRSSQVRLPAARISVTCSRWRMNYNQVELRSMPETTGARNLPAPASREPNRDTGSSPASDNNRQRGPTILSSGKRISWQ